MIIKSDWWFGYCSWCSVNRAIQLSAHCDRFECFFFHVAGGVFIDRISSQFSISFRCLTALMTEQICKTECTDFTRASAHTQRWIRTSFNLPFMLVSCSTCSCPFYSNEIHRSTFNKRLQFSVQLKPDEMLLMAVATHQLRWQPFNRIILNQ